MPNMTARARTAGREESQIATDATNSSGDRNEANFDRIENMPKNSPSRRTGTSFVYSERDRAWEPPCTTPTNHASPQNSSTVSRRKPHTATTR